MRFLIPQQHGTSLAIPPLEEYGDLLAKGRAAEPVTTDILGEPLFRIVLRARSETVRLAIAYTESLDGNRSDYTPDSPIIATGHQPTLFHPGVAIKYLALTESAGRHNAIPLSIVVDTDDFHDGTVPIPAEAEGLHVREQAMLFAHDGAETFETAGVEPVSTTMERLMAIQDRLGRSERLAPARKTFGNFLARLKNVNLPAKCIADRAVVMRRIWADEKKVNPPLELKVSTISKSEPFITFATHIIRQIETFGAIYNSELARYRKERKLRYPANPFPDLSLQDAWHETPFWTMNGKQREWLFAQRRGDDIVIKGKSGAVYPLEAIMLGDLPIRPRAITLSLYLRMFVCDLFIHGVGGAKYDQITDRIARKFYGSAPPDYACLTTTRSIATPPDDPAPQLVRIEQTLRHIEMRPESANGASQEALAPLAEKKRRLIESIQHAAPHEKKELGKAIAALNREMSLLFTDTKKRLEMEQNELLTLATRYKYEIFREYPFFFFTPDQVQGDRRKLLSMVKRSEVVPGIVDPC